MRRVVRKCVALLLLVCVPAALVFPEPAGCQDSQIQGRAAAEVEHSATGWFFGGFGSGFLLGLIGTGIITGVAAASGPEPDLYPERDKVDVNCYLAGYKKVARGKNTRSALFGGLLGTAAIVTVVLAAYE